MAPQVFSPYKPSFFHSWKFFALAVAFGLLVIAANAVSRLQSIQTATAISRYQLPKTDPSSPTGYSGGRRLLIMPRAADGAHWIMNAQRMAYHGLWRTRVMPDDNAPSGRSMSWSHGILWWMIFLGWVTSLITGLPLGAGIEWAASWCMVPVHLAFVVVLPWVLRRAFGWFSASILALGLATTYGFANQFFVGSPDHHGLVTGFLLAMVLFLAAGLVAPGSGKRFRFAASGLATGAAMWVSAATALPAIAGLGAGAGIFSILQALPANAKLNFSAPWRVWGLFAAGSSMGFYLLEFFPMFSGLRMEVNNAIYGVAVLGLGDLLDRLWNKGFTGQAAWNGRNVFFCLLSAAGILAPLAVLTFGGERVFVLQDAFLYRLHLDYIHEFKALRDWIALQHREALLVALTPLPLLLPSVAWTVFKKKPAAQWIASYCVALGPALVFTGLAIYQVRWMGTATSLWLAVLASWLGSCCSESFRLNVWEKIAGIALLSVIVFQMPQRILRDVWETGSLAAPLGHDDLGLIFTRDVAYRIRALGGSSSPTVLSGPTTTTWLMYFGGVKGLGTLYWENIEGLKSAAAIYNAANEEQARELLLKHNVSFVAILSTEPFLAEYPRLAMGLTPGRELATSFACALAKGQIQPSWAKPINMPVPAELESAWAAVFDVRSASKALKKN